MFEQGARVDEGEGPGASGDCAETRVSAVGSGGGGGSRWGGTLETMCRRTDGVAFDGETFDCSAFGGEVVGHWGGRAGHGGGVARGEGHVGDGASAEVILGGVWWGGHCGGRVDGGRGYCLVSVGE